MKPKLVGQLLPNLLPAGFDSKQQKMPQVQEFLEQNLPQPVNRCVTLVSLDREQIVIAANSPSVANYLRLHGSEIQQQLRETLGFQQALKFRSVPDAMLRLAQPPPASEPNSVGAKTIDALERSAQWIEDDNLRAAVQSLARSLRQS